MSELGGLYEKAAGRFVDKIDDSCEHDADYCIVAKCHEEEYFDFIDIICGGVRCSGYGLAKERKIGEAGPYYVLYSPTTQRSLKWFKVIFEVDDSISRYRFGDIYADDIYSLLTAVAVRCQFFGNGNRAGFEKAEE